VNPTEAVVRRAKRHDLLWPKYLFARIAALQAGHKHGQRGMGGRLMTPDVHIILAKSPGNDSVFLAALALAPLHVLWQALEKLAMQPAEEFKRMDGKIWFVPQALAHQTLDST
jgi:hypothetical protein